MAVTRDVLEVEIEHLQQDLMEIKELIASHIEDDTVLQTRLVQLINNLSTELKLLDQQVTTIITDLSDLREQSKQHNLAMSKYVGWGSGAIAAASVFAWIFDHFK